MICKRYCTCICDENCIQIVVHFYTAQNTKWSFSKIIVNKWYAIGNLVIFYPLMRITGYTITNTLRLSIYTSMNSFYFSDLEWLHSKTFETPCLMFWISVHAFLSLRKSLSPSNPSQAAPSLLFFSIVNSFILKCHL